MDELSKLIDQLVQQKTFSLDAVEQVNALREKAKEVEKNLTFAQSALESKRREILQLEHKVSSRDDVIQKWEDREKALQAREAKMSALEQEVAVSTATARVWDEAMRRMLANRTLRETVTSSVPVVRSYGSSSGEVVEHHNKTDTVTREEA